MMSNSSEIRPYGKANYSISHRIVRLCWIFIWFLLASWTPKKFAAWRRFLLRLFGARISNTSDVRGTARVWYPHHLRMEEATVLAEGVRCYNMTNITILANTIISQRVFLCAGTHDYSKASHPLVCKPIIIGPNCWVAAEAFISPGSTITEGCVIGARSVVNGELEKWGVYGGNPAIRIKEREYDVQA